MNVRLSAKMARVIMDNIAAIEAEAGQVAQTEQSDFAYEAVFIAKVSALIRDTADNWKGY